jgi:hypothetical protein
MDLVGTLISEAMIRFYCICKLRVEGRRIQSSKQVRSIRDHKLRMEGWRPMMSGGGQKRGLFTNTSYVQKSSGL